MKRSLITASHGAQQGQAQVLLVLQVPGHRAGQGHVRAGQPSGGVASHQHHAGDRRFPGIVFILIKIPSGIFILVLINIICSEETNGFLLDFQL